MVELKEEERNEAGKMPKGSKNLMIMGIVAVAIAFITTGVSLMIYHNSGDIYLDRSRPGYLPDNEEISGGGGEDDYTFSKNGVLTVQNLDEYLQHLDIEVKAIDSYSDPFGPDILSDENLGIASEE